MIDKILASFAYPLGIALLAIIVAAIAVLCGLKRAGAIVILAVSVTLWIGSTPLVARWAIGTLEDQYPPQSIETLGPADAIILLEVRSAHLARERFILIWGVLLIALCMHFVCIRPDWRQKYLSPGATYSLTGALLKLIRLRRFWKAGASAVTLCLLMAQAAIRTRTRERHAGSGIKMVLNPAYW